MVGTVAGVKARRFERRMSKEQPEAPASKGPLTSLLGACTVTLCSTALAEEKHSLPASRSRDRQQILRIEQKNRESEHLMTLINAQPLPDQGRRFSTAFSDASDKSVTSDY